MQSGRPRRHPAPAARLYSLPRAKSALRYSPCHRDIWERQLRSKLADLEMESAHGHHRLAPGERQLRSIGQETHQA